jgi:hypothetical protein
MIYSNYAASRDKNEQQFGERERERALNKIPRIYMTLNIDQSNTILAMVCNKPTIRNKLFSRLRDCLDNFLI